MEQKWIMCPVCASKTKVRVRPDTVMKNFPLFCPKCKKESLVSYLDGKIVVHST